MIPVMTQQTPRSALLAGNSTTAQFWPEISTPRRTDGGAAGSVETQDGDRQGTVQLQLQLQTIIYFSA